MLSFWSQPAEWEKWTEWRVSAALTPEQPFCFWLGLVLSRPSPPGPVPEWDEFSWVHSCPGSAQHGLSDRKENGTAKHAEHAKGGGALQGQDDAFDLKARLAEVE
jgi:hypothetical protein